MQLECELLGKQESLLKDIFYQPATPEVKLDKFTIAQKIDWQCRGGPIENADEWQLRVQNLPADQSSAVFKALKKDWQDASTLNLSLRFYKVSEKPWRLSLKKGEEEISLNGLEVAVASVLPFHKLTQEVEDEQGQMQKQPAPYPMSPALKMNYPAAMWIYLFLFISIFGGLLTRKWLRKRKLKKFADKVAREQRGRNPMQDFYKSLRALYHFKGSDKEYLERLRATYFNYLQARFYMPFEQWAVKDIYKALKNEHQELPEIILHSTYHNINEMNLLEGKEVKRDKLKLLVEDIQTNVENLDKNAKRSTL